MAFKTILNLRDSVAGILSGVDITTIADLNGCFQRAASTMIQKASIPEASGVQNLVLYAGVYDYLCDPKIFGTSIIDIRPQGVSRNANDFTIKTDQETFDRTKSQYPSSTTSTFHYENGTPIIRIVSPFPKSQTILDTMSSITGWAYNPVIVSAMTTDTSFYYQSPASIRFNLAAGQTDGFMDKTLANPINLSSYQGTGVAFLAVEIPTAHVTTYTLIIGTDSSNYYTVTNTTGTLGNITGEFMLVAFDLSLATTVGTPDLANINYIGVTLTYDGTAMTNVRFGGLWVSLPTPTQILYKSAAIFLPTGATTPLTTITQNTDEIILTDPAYNIYLQECALATLQNTGASDNDSSTIKINKILDGNGNTDIGLYARYRGDNPSQDLRQLGSWY